MHATLFANVKTASSRSRSFKLRMASGGECQKWRENYDHVVVFPALHGWTGCFTVLQKIKRESRNLPYFRLIRIYMFSPLARG